MTAVHKNVEELIRAESEKAYPNECCGCLFGGFASNGASVTAAMPIDNARESEERYHRFVITPEDFIKAERAAAKLNTDVVGFYHSHPDCPAKPSEYDREHALPVYSYIIVSVNDGKAAEMTCWVLSDDRETFNEESITI